MKNKLKYVLIAAFFIVLCLPVCIMIIQGTDTANLPKIINENKKLNTEFDSQMNDFVSDNQPFYDASIIANNFIKSKVFKTESANVIPGKNGYYFYTETKNDVLHTNTLTDREIYNIRKTLELLSEYCSSNNCKFVFAVAPDKGTVFPQYLPDNFNAVNQASTLDKLEKELQNSDVIYADLKSVLSNQDHPTYLKTDTHWNNYGALLAYNRIVEAVNDDIPIELGTNQAFTVKQNWQGDLAAMLYKDSAEFENQYYISNLDEIANKLRITVRGEKTRKSNELIEKIASTNENYARIDAKSSYEKANGKLFMLRDSFCRSMFPYFAYSYQSSTFYKSATYDAFVNPCDDFDTFVFEIVERNIFELLNNEQKIPAPVREDISDLSDVSNKKYASIDVNNDYDGYIIISGSIDSALLENNENIFVRVIDHSTNKSVCYEAFPGKMEDTSFGYYITFEDINENSEIQVIVNNCIVSKINL